MQQAGLRLASDLRIVLFSKSGYTADLERLARPDDNLLLVKVPEALAAEGPLTPDPGRRELAWPAMWRRRSWLSCLVLALVTGGLLLMHGVGAHSSDGHPAGEHRIGHEPDASLGQMMATSRSANGTEAHHHVDGDVDGDEAPSAPAAAASEASGHHSLAAVVALCVAVLMTTAFALRRIVGSPSAVSTVLAQVATRWRARPVDTFRPPGPGRLDLCILIC